MTNTNTGAANAAADNECANPVTVSKPYKRRLRALSETDKKTATSSALPTTRKASDFTASTEALTACDASDTVPEQPRQTKASVVEALLTREGGSSLEALCEATGWQTHTCRAFLTGLRKKGREVIRASDKDGKSIYLIATNRSPAPSPTAQQAETESA